MHFKFKLSSTLRNAILNPLHGHRTPSSRTAVLASGGASPGHIQSLRQLLRLVNEEIYNHYSVHFTMHSNTKSIFENPHVLIPPLKQSSTCQPPRTPTHRSLRVIARIAHRAGTYYHYVNMQTTAAIVQQHRHWHLAHPD